MRTSGVVRRLAAAMVAMALGGSADARAQERLAVGVLGGVHHTSADAVSGTRALAGATVAMTAGSRLEVVCGVMWLPGTISRSYVAPSISFGGPAVVTRFTYERRGPLLASVGVAWPVWRASDRRVVPRLSAGLAVRPVVTRRRLEHVSIPTGVTREQVEAALPLETRERRTLGFLSVGAGVSVRVGKRLFAGPEVVYDYGSMGDEIDNAVRLLLRVEVRP